MGDVDRLVEQLLSVKNSRPGTEVTLAEEDIMWLCRRCREVGQCPPTRRRRRTREDQLLLPIHN